MYNFLNENFVIGSLSTNRVVYIINLLGKPHSYSYI